jgi:hypothetical protein
VTLDPALIATLRAALALLWLAAAAQKLRDPARFRAALAGYALLPGRSVSAAASLLVLAELALGIALLAPGPAPALATAALLALYAAAVAINLARGRRAIDCGCGARPQPLGAGLVVRNAALAVLALATALPTSARPLVAIDALTVAGGVAALAALYAGLEQALANGARLRTARVRA